MMRIQRILSATAATLVLATSGYAAASALGADEHFGPADRDKVLYLTFDDGPGDETTGILEVLARYDAKAVFFTLGQNLAHNAEVGSRIVAEGHVLANHTWSHANLTAIAESDRPHEVGRTAQLLAHLGSESSCVRPPHGSIDDEVRGDLRERGLRPVLWNVDTEDWTSPGADAIVDRLLEADSGDVVLMHDGGGNRTQTVAALRRALPQLTAEGYRFETVPGC